MKTPSAPSASEWSALYQAAIEFKQLAPWEWMLDSDLFGVQNPDDGEVGYCCVMGNLGEHFALGVYLGSEGLEGHRRIQAGEFFPPDIGALHIQRCLMASYEDRSYLSKRDLDTIKSLGLKFRGRNAWPSFRDYRPGFFPWYLTAEQARFLTLTLQQAIDVGQRFGDDPHLLEPAEPGTYLVRVPQASSEGLRWIDEWRAPAPLEHEAATVPLVDEVRVERIRQAVVNQQGTWEVDYFFTPEPVKDEGDDRPYFPYVFLWVDRGSGMVLPPHMAAASDFQTAFQEHFLALIEQAQFKPKEVAALKQEALDLLEPIASRLKIKLRRSRRLGALEAAQNSLMGFFARS